MKIKTSRFFIAIFIGCVISFYSLSYGIEDNRIKVSQIELPATISESFYDIDRDGENEKIEIILINGQKIQAGNSEKWAGHFSIQISKGKTILSNQSLNNLMKEATLFFWAPEFTLVLKDYNQDGQIDFNLGQNKDHYSGNEYQLFTIKENGEVIRLPIRGQYGRREPNYFFIYPCETSNNNSTASIQTESKTIKFISSDPREGWYILTNYKWDGKRFVFVKNEKINIESLCPSVQKKAKVPAVISESFCDIDGDGKKEKIKIILTKGRRYSDRERWCGNGEKWEGCFSIQVSKGKTILSNQSLNSLMMLSDSEFYQERPLFFWAPEFTLILKDYNQDGQIDFNLGQYACCNGNYYQLFTIRKNGKVLRLPLKHKERDIAYFFISPENSKSNSTSSIQAENRIVEFHGYSNSRGSGFTAKYKWDGKQFVFDAIIYSN